MEFIVGTALAGIPIVLNAYEYYWKLSAGLSTFRGYGTELSKLDTTIGTQLALFRGNVVRVLTVLTDDLKSAKEILSNPQSLKFKKLDLPDDLVNSRHDLLRGMFVSWEATLKLVRDAILAICHELNEFQSHGPLQMDRSARMSKLQEVLNRFRLAWRKDSLQNSIKELRAFTADFNELTTRIVNDIRELTGDGCLHQRSAKSVPPAGINQNSLETYRKVRAASYNLYDIFIQRWACTRHDKHALNIRLEENENLARLDPAKSYVISNVAVDCACGYDLCQETPVWVNVEAVKTTSTDPQNGQEEPRENQTPGLVSRDALATLVENLTPYSRPMVVGRSKKPDRKLVEKESRQQLTHPTPAPSARLTEDKRDTSRVTNTSMVDLDNIQDHCGHFGMRNELSVKLPDSVQFINEPNMHRFHAPPPGMLLPEQQRSLEEHIIWVSKDEFNRDLPRTSIINLAYILATAVLRYHSTPWLPDSWKSSQVRFFSHEKLAQSTEPLSLLTPHLRIEFTGRDKGKDRLEAADVPQSNKDMVSKSRVLARNAVLFSFGIILLELGYGKPWIQLQEWAFKSLPIDQQTDYYAAEKLAQTAGLRSRMGPRFSTIVRKCLGCDFGLGENDLGNEQLQGIFLVDVIVALKEMEKGLIELGRRLE